MPGLEAITGMPAGRKAAVAVVLLALIAAVYYLVVHRSKVDELEQARQSLQSVESANRRARDDYLKYEELTAELGRARLEAEQLHKKLPTVRDIEGFMSLINAQAKSSGLRLTNIVPADEEASEYYVKLPIKLEFRGTYHEVLKFFTLVDREIARPVNMENLTLDRANRTGTDTEQPNLLSGSVRATTFMAKEAKADEQQ
ncbi:MAG: type 4a pilus biogenesis protein PilO [Myxococcota bacterium]|nr:type 4a pilus biogenesis protein PilO [Myxococcota bacterium]